MASSDQARGTSRAVRSNPFANYTKIPHSLSRDPRLSNGARGLLVQLLSHADGFRSDEEFLTTCSPDSRNEIRRQLALLRQLGYLVREHVRDERGHVTIRSVVYDAPQADPELPLGLDEESPENAAPSRRHPARRSEQGKFAKADAPSRQAPARRSDLREPEDDQSSPLNTPRRDGATSENEVNLQVEPSRRASATRSEQGKQGIAAGRTVSPDPGVHIEGSEKDQRRISQSAAEQAAARYLRERYGDGLTDSVIRCVIQEAYDRARRAGRPVKHLSRYLRSWKEELTDVVYAAQDVERAASRPSAATMLPVVPDSPATGCAKHPHGAVDPLAPDDWGRCLVCNDRRRQAGHSESAHQGSEASPEDDRYARGAAHARELLKDRPRRDAGRRAG